MGKIKQFIESEKGKDILMVMIVILVGLGSFELGRLSKATGSSGIQIEYLEPVTNTEANQPANVIRALEPKPITKTTPTSIPSAQKISEKNFLASNRGSKYYPIGCSAGKNIKLENRIYFETREAAEQAGYELSSSCN